MPIQLTGSLNISGSNTLIGTKTITGSVFISGSKTVIGTNTITGSMLISGSINTNGTITATTLVVQTITSSISSITGSTNFGSLVTDTHKFTGSLNVTGSLSVVTTGTEFQVNATGVNLGNALTDSHVISGSLRINPNGLFVSSSGNIGIGTSSPTDIAGYTSLTINNSASGPLIDLNNSGTNNMRFLCLSAVDQRIYGAGNLGFYTSGSNRMNITSAGNIGIGVTPSAWGAPTTGKVIQIGNRGSLFSYNNGTLDLATNFYFDGGNYRYLESAFATLLRTDSTNGTFVFYNAASGTAGGVVSLNERMRITSDGVVDLPYGQIKFPASQNASADANTLDDYEEGTWTPTLSGAGGDATYLSGYRNGWYTKIGRVVNIAWFISFSKNTLSGTLRLTGLPFALLNGPGVYYPQGTVLLDSLGTATNNITLQGANNTSGADFIGGNGSTATHVGLSISVLGAGSMECRGTLTYFSA
jgi:hypothetical protein